MTESIDSKRLSLIPMTPGFLRASLERDLRAAEQLLQACLPDDWPGEATDVLSLRLKQLQAEPSLQPWLLRAMVIRETRTMIGHIGFHNGPGTDCLGALEFGFTVFSAFHRQGFAREASLALMDWARETHQVRKFILSIRPANAASQALARGLGFVRIGSHLDEVDGLEDVLEYNALIRARTERWSSPSQDR